MSIKPKIFLYIIKNKISVKINNLKLLINSKLN